MSETKCKWCGSPGEPSANGAWHVHQSVIDYRSCRHYFEPAEPVIEVAPGEPNEHCDYCFTVKPCVLEDSSGRMMCQDCLDKAAASTGAPAVPAQACEHEHLNEDGICHSCGGDRRTGRDAVPAQEAPREPRRSAAIRLLGEVYSEFVQHRYVPAAPMPTDGSQDTRWMREVAELLSEVEPQAGAQPICKRCGFRKGVHHRITGICPGARSTAFEPAQAGAQVPPQEHPMRLFVRGMTREQLEAYALKVFASMIATEQTLWRTEAHLNSIKSYATEAAKTPITREDMHDPLKAQTFFDEHEGFIRLVLSEIGGPK